jgi:hypothetical protein
VTAPGPTISYLVHRGMLVVVVITIALVTGYLVFLGVPDLQEWAVSVIQAVREQWTSWHWSLA